MDLKPLNRPSTEYTSRENPNIGVIDFETFLAQHDTTQL